MILFRHVERVFHGQAIRWGRQETRISTIEPNGSEKAFSDADVASLARLLGEFSEIDRVEEHWVIKLI